jgi:hypothetical protein
VRKLTVGRQLRFYAVDARQRISGDEWKRIDFHNIAKSLQQLSSNGDESKRYFHERDERWFVDFSTIKKSEVLGALRRSRTLGWPQEEHKGKLKPLEISGDKGLAETNHFGVFDNNTLVYEINRSGLRVGELARYIESIMKKADFNITIQFNQLVVETFRWVLPKIMAMTRLKMRPVVSSLPKLAEESNLDIFKLLAKASRKAKTAQIDLSAGRSPLPKEAFGSDLAKFIKQYLVDEGNADDFEILEFTALLDTGELTPLDITDKHIIQKRVKIPVGPGRTVITSEAHKKISATYIEKKNTLQGSTLSKLTPDYEQVTL